MSGVLTPGGPGYLFGPAVPAGYEGFDDVFRAAYPQFSDLSAVAPATVAYWLTIAVARLDPFRWRDLLGEGLVLFVAHKVALGLVSAKNGGVGGGVVSSKSVGGVSIAYNTEMGTEENGGAFNITTYGREFLRLARMVGIGGIQF